MLDLPQSFFRKVGEFYHGKSTLPVFDWANKVKTPVEILDILLKPSDSRTTCSSVPNNIAHNVCFLVDKESLQSGNDWKSDDMGSWRNNGVQHFHLGMQGDSVFNLDGDDKIRDNVIQYTIKRTYYKNKSSHDLRKIISFLEGVL